MINQKEGERTIQAIDTSTRAALDAFGLITLRVYLGSGGAALDAEVVSATYTASVGGGGGFSIGNACSAELSIVLADAGLVAGGQAIRVTWDAAGTEYPLFVGKVSKATVTGNQIAITAYDALDGVSATPYQPSLTSSCTAAEALADIAEQMGVEADGDTQTLAAGTALTEGVNDLAGLSLNNAAANLALLLGGNAVITRDGALAVRQFAACGWEAESYSGDASPEDTAYTVDGLTFQRTDTATAVNEDGTFTETSTSTDYTAASGTGAGLTYSSSLATQPLVDGAFAALSGLCFWAGTFSVQGGIFLEPGDLLEVDGLTVAVSSLTLSLDGGCKASIASLGATDASGTGGSITQAISAIQQDYGEFKTMVAQNVSVTNANITNLQAVTPQLETAVIGKAEVSDLTAANATITDLTAEVADISSLLAGNVGAETVQTIHLTADNVVIDDAIITSAMIADLSASKLTAGTIYTSLIRIANDTGENFLIDGATLQIKDANGTYRIQMGEDGDGNYSYYLWDAEGNLIFDTLGAYALHDSIIKDVNVADDAAISGYKIDISTMTSALNEYGALIVDAAQITIDDTTLDYKLTTMVSSTAEAQAAADAAAEVAAALKSAAVADLTQYYAVGDSAEKPPSAPGDGVTRAAALADTAVADESRVGVITAEADWTTAWLTASDGLYLWTAFFVTYADGAAEWTTPTCLSDSAARDSISTLQTELEVVQGQITARVWQSDIDEAADALNESISTLQDRYSAILLTVDGITSEVADLTTVVSDNYTALQTKITTVEQTAEGLISRVSQTESDISDNAASITTLSSELTQLADSIDMCVTTDADTGYLRLGVGSDRTVKFTVESANLTIDEDGNATFSGALEAATGSFSGEISGSDITIIGDAAVGTHRIYTYAGDETNRAGGLVMYTESAGDAVASVDLTQGIATITGDMGIALVGDTTVNGFPVPEIQCGAKQVTCTGGSTVSADITFDTAFSGTPRVFVNPRTATPGTRQAAARDASSTGFTLYVYSASVTGSCTVDWVAVYG
ncbi:MAG: hypothetical protein LUD83_03190 [Clostridiales bacterium]|nr:hypothetical protein [Clostridiales bacterium]